MERYRRVELCPLGQSDLRGEVPELLGGAKVVILKNESYERYNGATSLVNKLVKSIKLIVNKIDYIVDCIDYPILNVKKFDKFEIFEI